MKLLNIMLTAAMGLSLTACNGDDDNTTVEPKDQPITLPKADMTQANTWLKQGTATVQTAAALQKNTRKGAAKNVILFVGDGMGISTVTAARILEGQLQGHTGEEHQLSFETLSYAGLAKTYNSNQQTPDSAGTMTAMMTGVKSKAGVLSIAQEGLRSDCASSQGKSLTTALELAEMKGKATGIISTARITHATPAATYAKSPERNWEDNSDMPQQAIDAGCKDIAVQLLELGDGVDNMDGIEVVMGGGRRHFLPKDASFNSSDAKSEIEGDRTDNRDLITEWQTKTSGTYVMDQAGFDAIDPSLTTKVLGLFNESHMRYEADRANDIAGEPSLSEMTSKAIDILKQDPDGYLLMVESGRIDHAHHAGNAANALTDTIEFAKAVKMTLDKVDLTDTLIIVTADHSHVFTIAGYPTRGNPILGKVIGNDDGGNAGTEPSLAKDNLPYTTLGYTNGRGFASLDGVTDADAHYDADVAAGRHDLTNVDTTQHGYFQEALVPKSSETHAGEDVGIYAAGPGASLLTGTVEQNFIFHVMQHAADLDM